MKNFSHRERRKNIGRMQAEIFDLVIVGGGITGAGAARDAAARGLKVALIEASDFASGTSSRSSKLIHGGIRYLENREFKLVFEALSERTKLFEMVPHLVHPLRFMIPLFANSRVGMFKMGLGMWLYDALSLFQAPEIHERLNVPESVDRVPVLRHSDLRGSYIYSDAYMDDDRLVIETLRSAHESGACCASYVKATGAVFDDRGKISAVECEDQRDGGKFSVRAHHVLSCVGPWTDQLGEKLLRDWKKILRPTKGVHITLPKHRLPLSCAVVMGAEKSDRIVFAIPRHEMIIIGTTDTDFRDSPEKVTVTDEDVNYLLKIADHYFPGAQLTAHDIIASYAGVRPLVRDDSDSEGKTSREHVIWNDPRGLTFVAGGKYTTYRLMAEQVVDAALKTFPFEKRMSLKKSHTAEPLNAATSVEAYRQALISVGAWSRRFRRSEKEVQLLAERFGMEAEEILNEYPSYQSYWQIEAHHAIEKSMCLNLVDFYTRRVPLFLADRNHGLHCLDEIGAVFQAHYDWSEDQLSREKHALTAEMARLLNWKKSYDIVFPDALHHPASKPV